LRLREIYILPSNFLILLAIFFAITTLNSFAQDKNYIALSSAVFDIAQQEDPSYETRLEFRIGKIKLFGNPFMGVMMNTDGAMHIYLGLYYDIPVINRIYITPSFAPGLYSSRNSKDLKFALVFQSQLEVSYRFDEGGRIGISFNHISNAGLGVENPGVESLAITFIIPL
jgi:hypothetical protein